ncbi:MAG: NAD(+)/NADH kinase [Prevotellaceae bacterium]|jgi:NAD+ kinase|nr:NAD(+)/NADH kinase [Prevotellaceae bacterium]
MVVAIYGRQIAPAALPEVIRLLQWLNQHDVKVLVHCSFAAYLPADAARYEAITELPADIHCLISLGGDGTFLESVGLACYSHTPVFGINTGRLGFLSTVPLCHSEEALHALLHHDYRIEERTLLKVSGRFLPASDSPYALNDVGVQHFHPSLVTVRVSVNDEALPDYWADGLLVATPTGSTAYSMSAGGPIVAPDSQSFIITPIASHNLNMRPLVIADSARIKLQIVSRKGVAMISIDNRLYEVPSGTEVQLEKAAYTAKIIRLHESSFFNTLCEKLSWGYDKRNA